MKIKLILFLTIICCSISSSLFAQIGGNQLYQKNNVHYNRNPVETTSVYTTDSTLIITSKVLMNQKADYYLVTVGVNQEAKTVIEANQGLDQRIGNVLKKLKNINVVKEDVYIDFISETKLYDHKIVDGNNILEYFDGFSIRKNIIIKVNELDKIDQLINFCSEEEIYDIIKVDYVNENLEAINARLLEEALKVIENKKQVFLKNSSNTLSGTKRLTYEKLRTYYPKNMYRQYDEAFETTLVNTYYNSNYTKKEVRKEKTFYYDGIETEFGVDKMIDEIAPTIGIQYILELQIVYAFKK